MHEEEVQARSPMLNQKCMKLLNSKGKPNGWICFAHPPTQRRILKLMLGSFKFDMKFEPVLGEY
jgi:hypothetical protein